MHLLKGAEREIVFGSLSVFIIEFDGLIPFFCCIVNKIVL